MLGLAAALSLRHGTHGSCRPAAPPPRRPAARPLRRPAARPPRHSAAPPPPAPRTGQRLRLRSDVCPRKQPVDGEPAELSPERRVEVMTTEASLDHVRSRDREGGKLSCMGAEEGSGSVADPWSCDCFGRGWHGGPAWVAGGAYGVARSDAQSVEVEQQGRVILRPIESPRRAWVVAFDGRHPAIPPSCVCAAVAQRCSTNSCNRPAGEQRFLDHTAETRTDRVPTGPQLGRVITTVHGELRTT
jgi:hypothetical protein